MFVQRHFLTIAVVLAIVFAIAMGATVYQKGPTPPPAPAPAAQPNFRAYWFGGKAELNHYRLDQAQYGAMNPGEAVLIFVTEDFRTDEQVKSETEASHDRSVPVLKTNYIRRFKTGVYDYSLFTSVFTPIDNPAFPNTQKVSTSGQEWCGHSYVQVNYKNNGFRVSGRSYFEQEVAEDYDVDEAVLEDELFNRIRLNPAALPTGDIHLITGTQAARLRHKRLASLPATATLDTVRATEWVRTHAPSPAASQAVAYLVDYKEDGRTLLVVFETAFPHRILGWEDTYKTKDRLLTSRAVLTNSLQSDYWTHNTPADSTLRSQLGVGF